MYRTLKFSQKFTKCVFEGILTTIRPPTPNYTILDPSRVRNFRKISGVRHQFGKFPVKFQWFESSSELLKYYWIFQLTDILWNSSDSPWNSQPRLRVPFALVMPTLSSYDTLIFLLVRNTYTTYAHTDIVSPSIFIMYTENDILLRYICTPGWNILDSNLSTDTSGWHTRVRHLNKWSINAPEPEQNMSILHRNS